MNKVILFGNLGADPELRTTRSGTPVANVRFATNRRVRDGDDWVDETEWHSLVFWDAKAKAIAEYCQKGDKLMVEGEIRTRQWEDNDGNTRYSTEIHCWQFEFGGKSGAEANDRGRDSQRRGGGQGRSGKGSRRADRRGNGRRGRDSQRRGGGRSL